MLVPLKGKVRSAKGTSAEGMREVTHVVQSGDNLGSIASKYRVSLNDLKEWNDIRKKTLQIGQRITLYVPGKSLKSKEAVLEKPKVETQTLAGQPSTVSTTKMSIASAETGGESAATGDYIIYTVQSGDSLFTIAKKFPGISDSDLRSFNNIRNVRGLYPGQQIKIPKRA
jgi:membrane-bound lytic murein transglycosylase D